MGLTKSDIETVVNSVVGPLHERIENLQKAEKVRKAQVKKQNSSFLDINKSKEIAENAIRKAFEKLNKPIKKEQVKDMTIGEQAHMVADLNRRHENAVQKMFASENYQESMKNLYENQTNSFIPEED